MLSFKFNYVNYLHDIICLKHQLLYILFTKPTAKENGEATVLCVQVSIEFCRKVETEGIQFTNQFNC